MLIGLGWPDWWSCQTVWHDWHCAPDMARHVPHDGAFCGQQITPGKIIREALLTLPKGHPTEPVLLRTSNRTFEDVVRADLRRYTDLQFHGLRHSHATALLLAGVP
jgi:integrase